ncbi:MAG: winged helix-turn-helix transcriptional regulator, partial [Synergistaceae bacterium]|nr:winged helix-turn-helix transcriptional regulator [Synergistaceae bacterium]
DIPRQNDGGILYLEWYLKQYSNTRLIIIDTFQKFRKQLSSRGNIYSEDYDAAGEIKRIADKYAVAILVIHHLRKLLDMSDPFNEMSGSQGLAGSADTNIIWKRPRQQEKGTIEFSGRDVEEKKYYLSCTKFADQFLWSLGDEIRAEDETTAGLSKEKQVIINYLTDNGGKTPKEVSDALKMNYNTCQQRLARMVQENLLRKTGAIYYSQDD